jgi:hypothetical protein
MFITKCAWCKSNRPLPDNIYCSPKCEHEDPSSEELIKKHQQEKAKAIEEHKEYLQNSKKHLKSLYRTFTVTLILYLLYDYMLMSSIIYKASSLIRFGGKILEVLLVLTFFITISTKLFYLNKTPTNILKNFFRVLIISLYATELLDLIHSLVLATNYISPYHHKLLYLSLNAISTASVIFLCILIAITIINVLKEKISKAKT